MKPNNKTTRAHTSYTQSHKHLNATETECNDLIDTMDVWEKPEELLKRRRRSAPLREDPVPALQARAPSVQLPVAPRAPLQQEAALFHPRAHDDVPMRREAALE